MEVYTTDDEPVQPIKPIQQPPQPEPARQPEQKLAAPAPPPSDKLPQTPRMQPEVDFSLRTKLLKFTLYSAIIFAAASIITSQVASRLGNTTLLAALGGILLLVGFIIFVFRKGKMWYLTVFCMGWGLGIIGIPVVIVLFLVKVKRWGEL